MANFLNTSKLNFLLEELIRSAKEELVLVSPYLKLNERIRELLQDLSEQVDIRIIYGKKELPPAERQWLVGQERIKLGFCRNLHAKCYLNEYYCIVTSMNLYDFSQVNNNEVGIGIHKSQDRLLYTDAYEEIQRLIRISEEISVAPQKKVAEGRTWNYPKLTTANLASHVGKTTNEVFGILVKKGYLNITNEGYELTEKGIRQGGGEKKTGRYGPYFLWNKPAPKK